MRDFLKPAYELTTAASGQRYTTLSMQPLIYETLNKHILTTINASTSTGEIFFCESFLLIQTSPGFTCPVAQEAALKLQSKLSKYYSCMFNPLCELATALDPSIGNIETEVERMKIAIREAITCDYGFQPPTSQDPEKPISLLDAAKLARAPNQAQSQDDEVDDYFEFTKKADLTCDNPIEWWGNIGHKRFPHISLLARDTLMCLGSSVPSESAFSDSGRFVTADRNRLSDEHIGQMMKLRSWNRLFKTKKCI